MKQNFIIVLILAALSMAAFYFIGYSIHRDNFTMLLLLFTVLFACYGGFIKLSKKHFGTLLLFALLFRVTLVFSFPVLSDDIYRFLWDGLLSANGINPFSLTPAEAMQTEGIEGLKESLTPLYAYLNSPNYYTIYPPIAQGIFAFAAWVSGGSPYIGMLIIKLFILAAEIGSISLLVKLLVRFKKPKHLVFLYALNPLVIVELIGNLHFEAFMIFFLLFALWLLVQDKWWQSALVFALAVCSKLIPLMFLPLLLRKIGWKKSLGYWGITGVATVLLFLPFLSTQVIENFSSSIDLYFRKFEFNASFYYLVREVGEWIMGYNIIQKAGPILGLVAGLAIVLVGIFNSNKNLDRLPALMIICLTIYLFCTTTVHPWYICTLIALAPLTQFRYILVWSGMALLSYYAYSQPNYSENMWLIALEYSVVLGFLLFETGLLGKRWVKQSIQEKNR